MTELEASGAGEPPPPYIIFVVVFFFFLTGLLGFLICHLLKKKGYRCRAGDMDEEEEEEEKKLGEGADDEHEENQDTVEQILKCIIENEANMEAFNEMLGNRSVCVRHDPRLRKESLGGVPPHHHTVHSGMDHNSCHLCTQVRTKKGRSQSRTPRFRQRPGEQTVFAVGRFRVTHTDKKPQVGPNPLVASGDQLDQSQDSEERKESGYNLRSMFKDVRPPSENVNGTPPNVGKRRRSLTLFGLRRGSDPVGVKVAEGTGRETGGIKFTIQEEPLQTDSVELNLSQITGPGSNPKSEPPKNAMSVSPQPETGPSGSVDSLTSQSKKQAWEETLSGPEGVKLQPSPEPQTKVVATTSAASAPVSVPSSLPILSDNRVDVDGKVLKTEGAYDPGPLQTSTPIAPITGSIPGLLAIPPPQRDFYSDGGIPVTQTPPDLSASNGQEPGPSLVLISLGSSPPSSFPSKTLSSVSSLKSPTSPLMVTPSPKLTSRNLPSDSARTALSAALTPSPKLSSGRETPDQSRVSLSSLGQTLGEDAIPKRAGILKNAKQHPVADGDLKGSDPSSSSDQVSRGLLSTLSPSPPGPPSPSSPQESKTSSVTIVKAIPDSKREFSIVTMPEGEAASTSIDKTSDPEIESENVERIPAVAQRDDGSASSPEQSESLNRVEGQEKDDMMEMEDIRDCKVTQDAGVEKEEEEEGGMETRSNQE